MRAALERWAGQGDEGDPPVGHWAVPTGHGCRDRAVPQGILLVVGAGGVFGSVLVASGVGDVLADSLTSTGLPLIVLAFAIALPAYSPGLRNGRHRRHLRHHRRSGGGADLSQPDLALICIAMGAGAIATSHINDAGYWLVSRSFGISEKDTLKSWTVLETIMGFTAFGTAAALSLVL